MRPEYSSNATLISQRHFSRCPKQSDRPAVGSDGDVEFPRPQCIEQVWFPGVHSNVGGGYPRAGMSYVALDWMMVRAKHHGLRFREEAMEEVWAAANAHGKLYDSRDGVAVYYRYSPRLIDELSKGYVDKKEIKIHCSAIERLKRFTAGYAPTGLPDQFQITHTDMDIDDVPVPAPEGKAEEKRDQNKKDIKTWVAERQRLYRVFVEVTLAILLLSLWLWFYPPIRKPEFEGIWGTIHDWTLRPLGDFLLYVLPKFFDGFVTVFFHNNPWFGVALIILIVALYVTREGLRNGHANANQTARTLLLARMPKDEGEAKGSGNSELGGESDAGQ